MPSDFALLVAEIEEADKPSDIFPSDDTAASEHYRKLARFLHPDVHPEAVDEATAAFARVTELWERRNRSSFGTLGGGFTLSTKRRTYLVRREPEYTGDIANLYGCVWGDEEHMIEHPALLKMPRSVKNNDLIRAEAKALKLLRSDDEFKDYFAYFPELTEHFRHRDDAKAVRFCNVLEQSNPKDFYNFVEIKREYPDGIVPKDAAWIWRRVLTAIGVAHQLGIVHGALVPENILVQPEDHGVVLLDWCYSTEVGKPLSVVILRYKNGSVGGINPHLLKSWYPDEVLEKRPVTPATDIYMVTASMRYLLGERIPKGMLAFARGCMLSKEPMRPHDAWALSLEFDDLLERMWGRRKFHPFYMPPR